jgi:GNAT superfamily N-acetyltransferase
MITIVEAVAEDVKVIREITRITWLATYPYEPAGITREDIEAEFDLDQTNEGKERMKKRIRSMADPAMKFYLAKIDDIAVGFFRGQRLDHCNRLIALYVLPDYQGKGIGTRLIHKGLEWFDADKDILVNVASYNMKAQAFYTRFGFVLTGKDIGNTHRPLSTGKVIPEIEMVRNAISKSY